MSLEKATISWSAKQLKSMVKNGKIDFNHIIQRSFVWEKSRKSALIESMIIGYPVPPIYSKKVVNESGVVYAILDGKQRLTTVKQYLNDEFQLTSLPPVTYYDGETDKECTLDVSGKKFSELPVSLQDHLNGVMFTIYYFENLRKEEEKELFRRLNNGKQLSAKSKALAYCNDIEGLLDVGSHKLFKEVMSEKKLDNKENVSLVMKAWCMLNQEVYRVSFESRIFNPILQEVEISDEEKIIMAEVFDLIVDVHSILMKREEDKVAKKLYTETHLISLVPFFKKAIDENISAEIMTDWLIEFFGTGKISICSVSDAYNGALSGTAKNYSIITRHNELKKSWKEFFKVDDGENSEEEIVENVEDEADNAETLFI